ncbi:MAG: phosphate ABC transporter substrate-binding protein PstS [Sulfolobales archaeon]
MVRLLSSGKLSNKAIVAILAVIIVVSVSSLMYVNIIGRAPTTTTSPTTTATTQPTTPGRVYVIMGGATFINPQMQAWIKKYMGSVDASAVIEYQSIGSGAGEAKFIDRALDVGVSDVGISRVGYEKLVNSSRKFIQIPLIAGAVAITYNLPEWNEGVCGPLRLTGEVVADIYLGKITYWNDDRIKSLQVERCRDLLPRKEIVGVHRSDGSGTTALFTTFLSKISREWFEKVGYGYTVEWPRDKLGLGEGGKGNEGVTAKVKATPYSIGYVEVAYAIQQNLPVATIRNKDGNFVIPNVTTITAALERATPELPPPEVFWGDLPWSYMYREGMNSYPIVGTPVAIIDLETSIEKLDVIKKFFRWVLTEGQKPENVIEGFVPLPKTMAEKALQYLEKIPSKG